MKRKEGNSRFTVVNIALGICFISFFNQCTGASKQQSPIAQVSIEENNADTMQTEVKETDSKEMETETTSTAERKFIEETTSEDGIVIRHYTEDDGYTNIYEYTYPNIDIQQIYNKKVRKIEKLLREKLPEDNLHYKIETDSITLKVTYTYKDKNHLEIELFYPGGITYVDMIRQGKDVKVVEKYSAD